MKSRLLPLLAISLAGCVASTTPPESTSSTEQATTVCGQTSVKGVDISHYDGTIDWAQAKAAGISFGYAKATESTNFVDPTFSTNWSAMKAAGVARGAYHFFHPEVDATAQADYVLKAVGTLEPGDLPIVCDLEQTNGVSEAATLADAITFLAAVTQGSGKTAVLYVSPAFLSSYAGLDPYPLWIANWSVSCPDVPSPWTTWAFWQNSDSGTVAGIPSTVDLDYFNGTLSELTGGGSSGGSSSGSGSSSGGSSSGGSSGAGKDAGTSSGSGSGSGSSSGSGSGSTSSGSSSGTSSGNTGGGSSSSSGVTSPDGGSGHAQGGGSGGGGDAGNSGVFLDQASGGSGCSVGPGKPRRGDDVTPFALGLLSLGLVAARASRRRSRERDGSTPR
jgi:lysozyme